MDKSLELYLENIKIETERLTIRHMELKDAKNLYEFMSDKESCYYDGGYEPLTDYDKYLDIFKKLFLGDNTRLSICERENDTEVGIIHIMEYGEAIELGYSVNPSQRNKGYCTEAVKAVIDAIFKNSNVKRIILGTIEKNKPSLRLIEKLGFKFLVEEPNAFYDAWDKKHISVFSYYLDKNN